MRIGEESKETEILTVKLTKESDSRHSEKMPLEADGITPTNLGQQVGYVVEFWSEYSIPEKKSYVGVPGGMLIMKQQPTRRRIGLGFVYENREDATNAAINQFGMNSERDWKVLYFERPEYTRLVEDMKQRIIE